MYDEMCVAQAGTATLQHSTICRYSIGTGRGSTKIPSNPGRESCHVTSVLIDHAEAEPPGVEVIAGWNTPLSPHLPVAEWRWPIGCTYRGADALFGRAVSRLSCAPWPFPAPCRCPGGLETGGGVICRYLCHPQFATQTPKSSPSVPRAVHTSILRPLYSAGYIRVNRHTITVGIAMASRVYSSKAPR